MNSALKADPAPDSGFIQNPAQMTSNQDRFPFDRVWCLNQGCDWSKYSSVVVSPVDTAHILKMSWWDNFNLEPKLKLQEERHIIAQYLRHSFRSAITNDASKYHEVVETPGKDTMIIELALVELVPTKAFLRVAGDIVGYLIPGIQTIGLTGSGSVAIEGRIRDADTGEIVFKFADREQDKTSIVNIEDITWHGHVKELIDDWAREFVELYDTPTTHIVSASNHFTLRPW